MMYNKLVTASILKTDSIVNVGIQLFVAGMVVAGSVALLVWLLLSSLTYNDGLVFRCLGAIFPMIIGLAGANTSLNQLKSLNLP